MLCKKVCFVAFWDGMYARERERARERDRRERRERREEGDRERGDDEALGWWRETRSKTGGRSMDAAGHKEMPMHWRRTGANMLADVEVVTPSSEVT